MLGSGLPLVLHQDGCISVSAAGLAGDSGLRFDDFLGDCSYLPIYLSVKGVELRQLFLEMVLLDVLDPA